MLPVLNFYHKTVTADQKSRLQIPEISPNQKFVYDASKTGVITLTPVETITVERFPPGSLKDYVTEESDREMLQILKGCSISGPSDDAI